MNPFRWRKMTWVLWIYTIVVGAWAVAGLNNRPTCPTTVSDCEAYLAGANIGTGVGMLFIFGIWFVGFIVLSIIWFMTRPRQQSV